MFSAENSSSQRVERGSLRESTGILILMQRFTTNRWHGDRPNVRSTTKVYNKNTFRGAWPKKKHAQKHIITPKQAIPFLPYHLAAWNTPNHGLLFFPWFLFFTSSSLRWKKKPTVPSPGHPFALAARWSRPLATERNLARWAAGPRASHASLRERCKWRDAVDRGGWRGGKLEWGERLATVAFFWVWWGFLKD